jgi:hypothetical protein
MENEKPGLGACPKILNYGVSLRDVVCKNIYLLYYFTFHILMHAGAIPKLPIESDNQTT